jgi:hypothetical protein
MAETASPTDAASIRKEALIAVAYRPVGESCRGPSSAPHR